MKKQTGASKRISTSLVTLGSAIITSVYAAGYIRTQSAADQVAGQDTPTAAVVRTPDATSTGPELAPAPAAATPATAQRPARGSGVRASPSATPRPAPTATPTAAPAVGTYRDGTYVAVGRSRHGNVQATVVVKGGRIASADVTGCSTRYPCDWVDPLPPQVVSQQNALIDYVSGATDSSMAYQSAVRQALAKAKVS